uniref:Uncharacterized protein n=1 Tax=Rhizophora mucronata TaxID=61149 RepID=A0A2P2PFW6_RHIMU
MNHGHKLPHPRGQNLFNHVPLIQMLLH